nr:hypothetical protein [Tanacetum cinerariifolium]
MRHVLYNVFSTFGFACDALFPWHTVKNVTRDPTMIAADFNAQDYATLVAHPSPFWKFPEEFLCLVGLSRHYTLDEESYPWFLPKRGEDMDLFAFIHTPDTTKVKVVDRERVEDKPLLLHTTVGCTVPLLLVALDRAKSEMEASVDKLFDEGGSGNQMEQGGFAGSGRGADVQLVSEATNTVAEDVAPLQPRRQRKRKTVVVGAGETSHPPKELREDHETSSGPFVAGKSKLVVQRLLAKAVLSADVRGEAIPTLPFVTSSVFATLEHEGGDHNDSAEVYSLVRSSVPVMTVVTTVTSTVDPALVVKEKRVKPSLFSADSSSAGVADPNTGVFSDLFGSNFLVGGIHTMVDKFAHPMFLAFVCGMKHDQLFTEFNVGVARQMYLSAEVRMCDEYNVKERWRLKSVVEKRDEVLKVRKIEIEDLKAQMLLKEAEAAKAIHLRVEDSNFEIVEKFLRDKVNALKERNTILEKVRNALDVKVTDLEDAVIRYMSWSFLLPNFKRRSRCMRIERLYPHLLSTISGHRWLLTHGMELAITKCLHSPEYLFSLRAAIGKAIEKGMQDGLSVGITHGTKGRALTDVFAYNPSTEVDYVSALQHIQSVNFSLLAELRSNKYTSVDTWMNILHLEDTLAERLGLTESQPHVDQLMVPIHHSPYKVVVGATALSLSLDVSNIRVLTGAGGTSDTGPAATVTTTALSITLASASTVAPISVEYYEVAGTDEQAGTYGNAYPFPNVDDAELNIP